MSIIEKLSLQIYKYMSHDVLEAKGTDSIFGHRIYGDLQQN